MGSCTLKIWTRLRSACWCAAPADLSFPCACVNVAQPIVPAAMIVNAAPLAMFQSSLLFIGHSLKHNNLFGVAATTAPQSHVQVWIAARICCSLNHSSSASAFFYIPGTWSRLLLAWLQTEGHTYSQTRAGKGSLRASNSEQLLLAAP